MIQYSILNYVPYSDIKALETMYILNNNQRPEKILYNSTMGRNYNQDDDKTFYSTQRIPNNKIKISLAK